jgi:hypothetical protein
VNGPTRRRKVDDWDNATWFWADAFSRGSAFGSMTPATIRGTRFTRRGLFKVLGIAAVVVGSLETYLRWRSGKWEATSLLVVPVFVWIGLVISYRWFQIMKEQDEGTFSEERYQADPQDYLWGSHRLKRLTIIIAVVILLVGVICITLFKL